MTKILAVVVAIFILVTSWNINKKGDTVGSPFSMNPLNIQYMRTQKYPSGDIKIEETLSQGKTYKRYIVSFVAEGLKEYALLTVPTGAKPDGGFPVIILNHGYIIPEKYTPDGNYIPHFDAFSKAGYIVFKPSYRGHGKSEGNPTSTYFSPDYGKDVMYAISSIKKYPDANPGKIGIWGHSMGGNISLRVSEISGDLKAMVIWGGVVGSYNDILNNWQNRVTYKPNAQDLYLRNLGSQGLLATYGTPLQNPDFWNSIDPTENLNFVNVPVQIHVGLSDTQVPPDFSKSLFNKLTTEGKFAEYFEYPGANHDINQSFDTAMQRTVQFFDRYLK